ncbi:hypothetical protein SAMN04488238_103235 [Roseicitreum antarcticum]|uniref:Uncharacterized protein n=2 Tax=Roseicitreum antarcticum TaxID=564137 RepID=A0A1H2W289_9RHOB|nr:hypothetical protein SAMN04488238_103235 [Roseicitreum antarcticum]
MRDLREQIPLEDEQIQFGLIDWVDANPDITRHAGTLADGVDDLAPKIWSYMQECQAELPDPRIPDKRQGLFARLFSG